MLLLNILILVNFLIIIPLFIHNKNAPEHSNEQQLNLNQEQILSFKIFADEHHEEILALNKKQEKLIPSYFATLFEQSSASNRDSLATEIQSIESQKLKVTYEHFEDIKSILNPEQEKDFPEFVEGSLLRIMGKNHRPLKRK